MSTDIAVRERNVLTNQQLEQIARTEFVPQGLRGNIPAILACVATGRALGIDDMTAIRSIHVIEGKATFSAELMVMLVRRDGHSITGEVGEGTSTVRGKRVDNGDEMTCTWTLAMAERAGLLRKQNWVKYPEAMLWARAVSQLCRMLFADCFAGATYTTEELGDEDTGADAVPQDTGDTGDGLFPPVDANGEIVEAGSDPVITDAQRRRLRAIQNRSGVSDDDLKELVWSVCGVESSKLIPARLYEQLVAAVEARATKSGFQVPPGALAAGGETP